MNNYEIGKTGEDAVAYFIEKSGCIIVERNYRTINGEIDIIFLDGDEIVFGEVKTRRSYKYGRPAEAVDFRKRNRITRVAREYILRAKIYDINTRFDIFEVYFNQRKIRQIKNAY